MKIQSSQPPGKAFNLPLIYPTKYSSQGKLKTGRHPRTSSRNTRHIITAKGFRFVKKQNRGQHQNQPLSKSSGKALIHCPHPTLETSKVRQTLDKAVKSHPAAAHQQRNDPACLRGARPTPLSRIPAVFAFSWPQKLSICRNVCTTPCIFIFSFLTSTVTLTRRVYRPIKRERHQNHKTYVSNLKKRRLKQLSSLSNL